MRILALETSTEYCSVALWLDGKTVEHFELVGQKHSEELMNMLDKLLQEHCAKSQLTGIAFGKGPGSFTGVRIACGTTQGLALGLDLPVLGICTLEALAQASGHHKVIAALDARMGEIYHAAYQKQGAEWLVVSEPCLCKPETAPVLAGDDWYGVGSGFATHGSALAAHYAMQLSGVNAEAIPRAAAIAELAAVQFTLGRAGDAATALPLYLRDKVALTTSERAAR